MNALNKRYNKSQGSHFRRDEILPWLYFRIQARNGDFKDARSLGNTQ
jgi:hypothetical protein